MTVMSVVLAEIHKEHGENAASTVEVWWMKQTLTKQNSIYGFICTNIMDQ